MILLRCYAKVTDWIYEVFNHAHWADYRFVPIQSYGFWVAVGFFAAATLAAIEMRRREKLGLLKGLPKQVVVGGPPNMVELALTFIISFIVFYKVGGIFTMHNQLAGDTPQLSFGDYMKPGGIASIFTYGSWLVGLLGAGALSYYYYYTAKKEQLPVAETRTVMSYPSENIGDLVIIAAVLGILGSVLFNFLESGETCRMFVSQISEDPVGFLTSGLSVYGGLICAGIGFAFYAYYKKFHLGHFLDSVAPGYMLANGIGRLGCQMSGDGDWGVVAKPAPDWFPAKWFWSDNYAHHIIGCDPAVDVFIPGCTEEHCCQLAQAVYPTPIYEFLMCTAVCLILYAIIKKLTYKPGMILTIFMMLIGIQRFAIEQWRDLSGRELTNILGMQFKQSELISIVLFILGALGTAYLWNRYKKTPHVAPK